MVVETRYVASLQVCRAAVVRQPYILINEDKTTKKSPNMGSGFKCFFSDICSVI